MAFERQKLALLEQIPEASADIARRKELIRQVKDDEALYERALKNGDANPTVILERMRAARSELRYISDRLFGLLGELNGSNKPCIE